MSAIKVHKYGECECGGELYPIWFMEEQTTVVSNIITKTGKVRRAVDVLICPCCMKEFCVDESFDGPWMPKEQYEKLYTYSF